MLIKRRFTTILLTLGLSSGLTAWAVAQTTGTGTQSAAVQSAQKELAHRPGTGKDGLLTRHHESGAG
jgi:hypothetical protein